MNKMGRNKTGLYEEEESSSSDDECEADTEEELHSMKETLNLEDMQLIDIYENDLEDQVTQSSYTSEEILYQQDLTLDKDEIARDLLGEGSEGQQKDVRIGVEYQAFLPERSVMYGDSLPYENKDELLWTRGQLSEKEIIDYLQSVTSTQRGNHQFSNQRDDEHALHTLVKCDHNINEALRRERLSGASVQDPMSLWSSREIQNFEEGLDNYGKNFFLIQANNVRTRSVAEIVHFYYWWKKNKKVVYDWKKLKSTELADDEASPIDALIYGDPKWQARCLLSPSRSNCSARSRLEDEGSDESTP